MSLSNALSNAVSGIVAASRGTEVVASNLSNALTPGYARRELQLSTRPYIAAGGGVHVDSVTRSVRTSVLAQSRISSAETARAQTLADFHKQISDSHGVPGEPGALATLLSDFDVALTAAAARPENETGLSRVVTTAQSLARGYNSLGTQLQDARTRADQAIASDVRDLNEGLARIVELNRQITVQLATGDDANALMDSRQQIVDRLSQIVPVQEMPRDGGRIALFTTSGGVLLDGFKPAEFDFTPSGKLGPGMSVGTPPVGVVSMNGVELAGGKMGILSGGRLDANFRIRDVEAPAAQARLDAAARDLYERCADPSVDATKPATAAGLFTDGGGALDPANEAGLAQRLSFNALADPAKGGALWRLRDGLGATTSGPAGNSALLDNLRNILADARLPSSAGISGIERSAAVMVADVTSTAAIQRVDAESLLSGASAQSNTYETMLRQDGVDSDREMESLLALERAYAANAKVLQTVDDMIQTILRLT